MTMLAGALLLLAYEAGAQAGAPTDSMTIARMVARADSQLTAAVPRGFNGVVRIERNGVVVLFKGYGLADRAEAIPFTTTTVVQLGTSTKNLTLAALLRLQAAGKLRLTDTLTKYFPDAPADKRRVTLLHLVNHTASLPSRFGGDYDVISRDEFTRRALEAPLRWNPGANVSYSDAGYALLAAIIEQVAGKTYDEEIRDDVLAPLGLANTGFLLPNFEPARLAHSYLNDVDMGTMLTRPHAPDGAWWNMRGSSGTLSTLGDMHDFYAALFATDTLLKTAAKKPWFNPAAPVKYIGSDPVSSFLYERVPKAKVEVIIATNSKGNGGTQRELDAMRIRADLSELIELLLRLGTNAVAAGGSSRGSSTATKSRSSRKSHHRTHISHHFHHHHH